MGRPDNQTKHYEYIQKKKKEAEIREYRMLKKFGLLDEDLGEQVEED